MKVFLLQALHHLLVLLINALLVVAVIPTYSAELLSRLDDWLGMREILAKAEQCTAKERKA